MIEYIRHIGIPVSDIERAIKFYQGLGFKLETTTVESWRDENLVIAKMSVPGRTTVIELVQGNWPHHFAISVPQDFNCSRYKIKIRKNNIVFITDQDENYIEIVKGLK